MINYAFAICKIMKKKLMNKIKNYFSLSFSFFSLVCIRAKIDYNEEGLAPKLIKFL